MDVKKGRGLPILCLMLGTSFSFAAEQSSARLTLEDFLKRVEGQNLDLKIESEKAKSVDARSGSLGIPPPMVGSMQMREQNGDSAQGIEVSQMLPFPTKLYSNKSARNYESKAQEETRLGLKAETLAQAKYLYVSLWSAWEKLNLLRDKKNIIEGHLKLSKAVARSDSFLRIHSLKSESEIDLLENEILSSEQELKEKNAEVARFLNADVFSTLPVEPPLSPLPKAIITKSSHQLEAAKFNLESLRSKESEGLSAWLPDIYVRYKELNETRMNPKYSEVLVGISLPFLFPWEPASTYGQASADRMRGEYEYEKRKREIQSEQSVLLLRAESLKKQLDNITQRLLPRAEKRMKIARNVAQRDMETLQDHRETMEAFPELKLKSLELRLRYEGTIAALKKYEREERE